MVFYICSNSLSLSFCDYNFLFCYLEIIGELYNDIIYWVGIRVVINVHASLHLKSLPPSPSLLSLPPPPPSSLFLLRLLIILDVILILMSQYYWSQLLMLIEVYTCTHTGAHFFIFYAPYFIPCISDFHT